jgi:hypothetical protein
MHKNRYKNKKTIKIIKIIFTSLIVKELFLLNH